MTSKSLPPWLPIVGVGALGGILLFMVSRNKPGQDAPQVIFTPDYSNYPLVPVYDIKPPTYPVYPPNLRPKVPITLPVIIEPEPEPEPPDITPTNPAVGGMSIQINPFIKRDAPEFTRFSPRYARIYPKVFLSRLGIDRNHD